MSSAVVVLVLAVICLGPCVHSQEVNEQEDVVMVRCRSAPLFFVYMENSLHPQSPEAFHESKSEDMWSFDVSTITDVSHIESAVVTCDSLPTNNGHVVALGAWFSAPRRLKPDSTLSVWPQLRSFSQCGVVPRASPFSVPPRWLPVGARTVTASSTVGPTESIACYLHEPPKA